MLGTKKEKKPGTSATGSVTIFRDGLVHATVYALSVTAIGDAWNRGNALDDQLVDVRTQLGKLGGVLTDDHRDAGGRKGAPDLANAGAHRNKIARARLVEDQNIFDRAFLTIARLRKDRLHKIFHLGNIESLFFFDAL